MYLLDSPPMNLIMNKLKKYIYGGVSCLQGVPEYGMQEEQEDGSVSKSMAEIETKRKEYIFCENGDVSLSIAYVDGK